MNRFMTGLLGISMVIACVTVWNYAPIQAQSDDEFEEISSSSAQVQEEQVQESIRERIQMAVNKSQNDGQTPLSLAYVGLIESITDQSITITVDLDTRLISIDDNTLIIDEDQEELSIEDLALESGVIVITSNANTSNATATEIISLEEVPTAATKKSVLAEVVTVDEVTDTLELIIRPNTEVVEFELTKTSLLTDPQGEEITLDEITVSDQIILIYSPEDTSNEIIRVQTLSATSSADATPSAVPQLSN